MNQNPVKIEIADISAMGMPLEQWKYETCIAEFGVGPDWATLYHIVTPVPDRGKGYATTLLIEAKAKFEGQGKKFGGTVALNDTMKDIYKRLAIEEYN